MCTLPLAPSCQGAAINGNGQSPEQRIGICVHMSSLVIQRRLDDRVFALAASVYLSLPLPFFFVLLSFFLHDDHPSNRKHRRS